MSTTPSLRQFYNGSNPMTLTGLTEPGINLIHAVFDREDRDFEYTCAGWKDKTDPQSVRMQNYCAAFREFRNAVNCDKPIEEAFRQWVSSAHGTALDELPDIVPEDHGKINVPQYAFLKAYESALSMLRADEAAEERLRRLDSAADGTRREDLIG